MLKAPVVAKRPPFERIALLLQGGGALGAYQGGVYQALAEARLHPDWVAGISIGAVNAALIAGNAPEQRVTRLREFWESVSEPGLCIPYFGRGEINGEFVHGLLNQVDAVGTMMFGARNFFTPRVPPPFMRPLGTPEALSYYDVTPLRETLERLVDFDRINAGTMRLSVGAVNIRSGNFVYFDTATHRISPLHVMASGALPPGFPPTEIDGEYYWDGGVVTNTPLQWVLDSTPRQDTLAFQVDLWNARGEMPRDLLEAATREKEIRFSSRTRAATDQFRNAQALRRALAHLLDELPNGLRRGPEAKILAAEADSKVFNIIQLIYRARTYEGTSKDFEFSRRMMEEHWNSGYSDAVRTLRYPEVLQRPTDLDGVFTFDLAEHETP